MFVENSRVVTDSITVADVFGKEHARVMRDIRTLGCSEEFRVGNFAESSYVNLQGRDMPKFIITEQGFALLVMGYTGQRAMEFKERYISEFHSMQQQLLNTNADKVVPLSKDQALITVLRTTADLVEGQEEIRQVVAEQGKEIQQLSRRVDEQITLDSGEQRVVQKAVAKKVYNIAMDEPARREFFRQLHREIKDRWAVPSYKDVRRTELLEVLRYIDAWRPRIA